jgi:hypothetical protein
MPTSVRVAVTAMSLLAGLLLLSVAVSLYLFESLSSKLAETANISVDEAQSRLLVTVLPYLVFGLLFAISAWFLARRHAWARWIGLTCASVVAMLHVLAAISGAGIALGSLLQVVLALTVITSLLSKRTAAWVPRLGARRRAVQDG